MAMSGMPRSGFAVKACRSRIGRRVLRKTGMAARWLGALALAHLAIGTAMACGSNYTIDASELTRTVNKAGAAKSVTWALKATHPFGLAERTRMIGGAPMTSWVRFSSDGSWTARIGFESNLRIRPAEMRVAFGFALDDIKGSSLIPTARSGDILVAKQSTRWIDISGKGGPKGITYDIMMQGNVAPSWTVSCAVRG